METTDLDVVIPLYNSEDTLLNLISRLNEWSKSISFRFHVIFVEDGSVRNSRKYISNSQLKFEYTYIQLAKNYGQHTATAVGLSKCTSPLVVTIDDDLQHDPFEISKLMEHQRKTQVDLIFATFNDKRHSFLRNLGSRFLKGIFKLDKIDYSDVTSFRLMKLSVANRFSNLDRPIVFIEEHLIRNASSRSSCTVNHVERVQGQSSYTYWKLILFALKVVLFHSSLLLKLVVRFGILIAVACFLLGCYYIHKKIVYDSQMGFSSIIVSIFFSTGILMVTLGIIGEYIRRIWVGQQGLDKILVIEEESE